jgi:uncharacterized membrane-anchored protein
MIRINQRARRAGVALAWALAALGASAQASEAENADLKAEVARVRQVGPAEVALRDQAKLKLPEGAMFVPQPAANKILKSMGNHGDERVIGLIYPTNPDQDWAMVAEYEPAGYIKDDDARDWNADDLLKSLKEGTVAANEERKQAGFPALEVTGWAEKPAYEAATHRLVWAATAVHAGAAAGEPAIVNYNTYALGRQGYISINLLTDSRSLDADKVHARDMLSRLDFVDGKRYTDFDSKTDHIAEYGLAALVAGVAVKKLGLLALVGVTLLKFWKIGLIALAGVGSLWPRLRKRFGKQDAAAPEA